MVLVLSVDHIHFQVGYDMTKSAAKKLFQKAGMYVLSISICIFYRYTNDVLVELAGLG